MAEPDGYLFNAGDSHVPPADWQSLPPAASCSGRTIELEYDPAGNIVAIHDLRHAGPLDEELAPIPYADPPAIEQDRPYTQHRYPKPKVSRQPDTEWTIGDALTWLDPRPPRRTLSRWLRALTPLGWRTLPQGGPPARTYRAREIMQRHARWAKNHGGTSGGIRG